MNFKLIFMVVLFVILIGFSSAASCVTAEISDISPSSIEVGEEFTVGIQIENCGTNTPRTIYFELLNPPTDISIKEPLKIEIPKLNYGNSERFITYHMKSNENASPGTYVIKTRLSYDNAVRNYNITLEIIGNEAELGIASLKTKPVMPRKGETVELTMRIENTGEGTAKSVQAYLDHPFQGLKQAFLGSLNPNEDGPVVLTFIVDESGEFDFPLTVSYYDEFGKGEIKTDVKLNVLKKQTNVGAIIFVILLIVIFGWGIYYFRKTKKAKDRTIHQLLQGENFNSKELKTAPKKSLKKPLKKSQQEKLERAKKEKRREDFKREILEKYKK